MIITINLDKLKTKIKDLLLLTLASGVCAYLILLMLYTGMNNELRAEACKDSVPGYDYDDCYKNVDIDKWIASTSKVKANDSINVASGY